MCNTDAGWEYFSLQQTGDPSVHLFFCGNHLCQLWLYYRPSDIFSSSSGISSSLIHGALSTHLLLCGRWRVENSLSVRWFSDSLLVTGYQTDNIILWRQALLESTCPFRWLSSSPSVWLTAGGDAFRNMSNYRFASCACVKFLITFYEEI